MTNYKYTDDNKKVIIIGDLNSQEKIVQEIFISDNKEIPSGEHFVVKSLHDSPVISWKEKRTIELEEQLEKRQKESKTELDSLEKRLKENYRLLSEKLKYTGKVLKNVSEDSFELLRKFLCGEITHFVTDGYNPKIHEFGNKKSVSDYEKELKLVSLFGRDDGTLQTYIHQYSDYSGYKDQVFAFSSYEEARTKLIEFLEDGELNEDKLKEAQKHNYEFSKEKIEAYKESSSKEKKQRIENLRKEIEKYEEQVKVIESL